MILWRDAETTKEQEQLFDQYGLRWSELWCLSYWDPRKQLVVDSVHCLLEHLLEFHLRDLLGLTSTQAGKSLIVPAFQHPFKPWSDDLTLKQGKQVHSIQGLLVKVIEGFDPNDISASVEPHLEGLHKKLDKSSIPALEFVCSDLGCSPVKSGSHILKREYIANLIEWVSSNEPPLFIIINLS